MLNEETKLEVVEGKTFEPLPENVYQCELLDVNSRVVPDFNDKSKMVTVLDWQFTLLSGKEANGDPARGRNLWRNFCPNYFYIGKKNGKNILYQIVETLLARTLKPEEAVKVDSKLLNTLIGQQCRVVVKNKIVGDKTYSNIASFLPVENQLPPLTEEEKDKARVKNKVVEEEVEHVSDLTSLENNDVPVIGLTQEDIDKSLGEMKTIDNTQPFN